MLKSHSDTIIPNLTVFYKENMLTFCYLKIVHSTWTYDNCKSDVHVDEKWFYLCQEVGHYYLVNGEAPPVRCSKSKSYMLKIMFFCAGARPRYDYH